MNSLLKKQFLSSSKVTWAINTEFCGGDRWSSSLWTSFSSKYFSLLWRLRLWNYLLSQKRICHWMWYLRVLRVATFKTLALFLRWWEKFRRRRSLDNVLLWAIVIRNDLLTHTHEPILASLSSRNFIKGQSCGYICKVLTLWRYCRIRGPWLETEIFSSVILMKMQLWLGSRILFAWVLAIDAVIVVKSWNGSETWPSMRTIWASTTCDCFLLRICLISRL